MLDGVSSGADCIAIVALPPAHSIDFVLADPPCLVRYHEDAGTWASTSTPIIAVTPARACTPSAPRLYKHGITLKSCIVLAV
jgi:hypothetical protein